MQRALLDAERRALTDSEAAISAKPVAVTVDEARSLEPAIQELSQSGQAYDVALPDVVAHESSAELETEKLLGKLRKFGKRNLLAQAILLASTVSGLIMLLPSLFPPALAMGNVHPHTQPADMNHVAMREEIGTSAP